MLTTDEKRRNKITRTHERFRALTIGKCKTEALREFQKLRRMECANSDLDCICISCGKASAWNACDAGHYLSRRFNSTAFSKNNCWTQCVHCNQYLSGNQSEYRKALVSKIGVCEVLFLETLKDIDLTFNKFQLATLREIFKEQQRTQKER